MLSREEALSAPQGSPGESSGVTSLPSVSSRSPAVHHVVATGALLLRYLMTSHPRWRQMEKLVVRGVTAAN